MSSEKSLPQDVLAQVAGRVALVDRRLQPLVAERIFVAQIDVGRRGPGGVAAEDDPFEDLMRIVLHQDAIVERARLALVGVDAHVDRAGMVLGQEGPFQPGGKAGPAAAAELAGLDHFDDSAGRHSASDLLSGPVAAGRPRTPASVWLFGLSMLASKTGSKSAMSYCLTLFLDA